jgi:hypothetical protein
LIRICPLCIVFTANEPQHTDGPIDAVQLITEKEISKFNPKKYSSLKDTSDAGDQPSSAVVVGDVKWIQKDEKDNDEPDLIKRRKGKQTFPRDERKSFRQNSPVATLWEL